MDTRIASSIFIGLLLTACGSHHASYLADPDGGDERDAGSLDASPDGSSEAAPEADVEPDGETEPEAGIELPVCAFSESPVTRPDPPPRPDAVDYLVISADQLLPAAEEFADYRDLGGHRAEVLPISEILDDGEGGIAIDGAPARMRHAVRDRWEALAADRTLFVLLLGDAIEDWEGQTHVVPVAEVGVWMWGDPPVVTSDNYIADLDRDHLPDVAVGRIPTTDVETALHVFERIQRLETEYEPGDWNRRFHIFASEAGFGDLVDQLIEEAGFAGIEEVPYEWGARFLYARPGSPWAYPPAHFSDGVFDLLNSGSMLVAYMGHGWEEGFTWINWDGDRAPILDTSGLHRLDMRHRLPLLLFIACSTGSFDTGESLVESFLAEPGGPAAILASTEISHPYADGVMTRETSIAIFTMRLPTLGEIFVEAKRRMVTAGDDPVRVTFDTFAGLDETTDTQEEREDMVLSHQHMYALLGDPAQVMPYPAGSAEITLEAEQVTAGEPIRACIQIHGPPEGHAVVTLEVERDVIAFNLEPWEMDDPDRDDVVLANNALANDKVVARWEGRYSGGGLAVAFPSAVAHTGRLHLRVYAYEGDLDAIGSAAVMVIRP